MLSRIYLLIIVFLGVFGGLFGFVLPMLFLSKCHEGVLSGMLLLDLSIPCFLFLGSSIIHEIKHYMGNKSDC